MSVHFKLKKANNSGLSIVLLRYRIKDFDFQYSTGIKIKKSDWLPKINSSVKDNEVNIKLRLLESTFLNILNKAFANNVPLSKEYLKTELDFTFKNIEKPIEKIPEQGVVKLLEEFIKVKGESGQLSFGTLRKYKSILSSIKDISPRITVDKINHQFYTKFVTYCRTVREQQDNTLGKNIAGIKAFMRDLERNGYNVPQDFKEFKKPSIDTQEVALTEDELMDLYFYQHKDKFNEMVKDVFCFGAFTGMRYSDYSQLKQENIIESYATIVQQKTSVLLSVPLNKYAIEILEKYNYAIPNIHNQTMNRSIKRICKLVGIDSPIQKIKLIGTNRTAETKPKYSYITTHTGRRTFITIAILKGVPIPLIMRMTGHKKVETLMKYAKISSSDVLAGHNKIFE
ncbi:MAG: tyrosine-type recombinase/integrase [Chlamydiia bacterium]|nr:tyrosine-type recombinase/integrase [Chlamydiia bacterium]